MNDIHHVVLSDIKQPHTVILQDISEILFK